LHIRRTEWAVGNIWSDIKNHARLRFDAHNAGTYNILQKFSYVVVIFILLPMMIFTGLAMSPAMNAVLPWLHDIFAGRQSARSIHFMCAALLFSFVLLHLAMVFLSGPINGIRSMITGKVPQAPHINLTGVAS
jgi:thiosulfate reductase cytochrome b subunit